MLSERGKRIAVIATICCVLLCVAMIYYFFSPTESKYFPKCMFYTLTGWECPGCGVQRAFSALLHGEIAQAIAYNPFLCLGVPYLLLALIANFGRGPMAERIARIVCHRYVVWGFVVMYFVWWILRNLI